MAASKLTPEQQADLCVEALKKAKTTAKVAGKDMTWPEVRATLLPYLRPRASDASDSPFGVATTIPPLPEWVTAYSASIGYPMDGQAWCDSYEQGGWKIKTKAMKNWQASVRTWKVNRYGQGGIALAGAKTQPAGKDYSKL